MQIKKLVPSLTEQWKKMYEKERPNLVPNAITGEALCEYVMAALNGEPMEGEAFREAIAADVKNSAFFAQKLHGAEPDPATFRLSDGSLVGIDRVSGWFLAENDTVRDRLTFVKGLDEADLENVIRTVDWLRCKKTVEAKPARRKRPIPPRAGRNSEIQDEKA